MRWIRRQAAQLLLTPERTTLARLLRRAIRVKLGHERAETLRESLEAAFVELGRDGAETARRAVAVERHREQLALTPYKFTLHSDRWGADAGGAPFRLAARIAARDGITFDIIVLRHGDAIPPHAHLNTVSGMLVLEGEVGIRTFDVVADPHGSDEVLLQPGLAGPMIPGDVSTLSDAHHNLHWVHGVAPVTLILRLTVTNIGDALTETAGRILAREYCLPREALADGRIRGEWVDRETAEQEPFPELRVA